MDGYRRWCATAFKHDDPMLQFSLSIISLPVTLRKILLTIARVQVYPEKGTRLYKRIEKELRQPILSSLPGPSNTMRLLDLVNLIREHLNPLGSSIISLLLRQAPYHDYSSVIDEQDLAINKEITAAVNTYHPVSLNYTAIFSNQNDHLASLNPVAPNIPIQPSLTNDIRNRFHSLKKRLWLQTFLPRVSTKLPGRDSQLAAALLNHEGPFSYADAEVIYFRTGLQLGGMTEVRSAWKFNDLKPRVYYAQGFTQFHASKYIQRLFSMMVDLFDNTHTFGRFNTSSVDLSDADLAYIYDYSAFTSTLHELKHFTSALASFFRGTKVRVLDTYSGIVEVDVGDLLDCYNDTCNDFAPIDVADLYSIEEAVLYHNTGMLGVPGNITSSTLLHGIHLSLIVGSIRHNKVVGDDAFGAHGHYSAVDIEEIPEVLQNLGKMAVEKMESWKLNEDDEDPGDWHYLKRPVYRVSSRLIFGDLYHFPGLDIILGERQPYRNFKYRTLLERVKIYSNQLFYLFRSLQASPQDMSSHSLNLLNQCIKASHIALGIERNGHHPDLPNMILPLNRYSADWMVEWFDAHDDEAVNVPVESCEQSIPARFRGCYWYGTAHPMLSLFKKLHLVMDHQQLELVRVGDFRDRIREVLERRFTRYYLYVVHETIPLHLWEPFRGQYSLLSSPDIETAEYVGIGEDLEDVSVFGSDSE